jgi:hypothetical protein
VLTTPPLARSKARINSQQTNKTIVIPTYGDIYYPYKVKDLLMKTLIDVMNGMVE